MPRGTEQRTSWKVHKIFLSASVSYRAEPRRFNSRCRTATLTSLKTLLVLFSGVCGRKINVWQGQIYWFLYSHLLVLPMNILVPKSSSCSTSLLVIQKPSPNHTWTREWPCSHCHHSLVLAFIDRHELAFGSVQCFWVAHTAFQRPSISIHKQQGTTALRDTNMIMFRTLPFAILFTSSYILTPVSKGWQNRDENYTHCPTSVRFLFWHQ